MVEGPGYSTPVTDGRGHAPSNLKRLPELDGLRGVAILLVLVWHYVALQADRESHWGLILLRLLSLTWTGVDLFFVLSGLLIGGIILDHARAENFLPVFYARRALRILPLYWIVFLGYLLALGWGLGERWPVLKQSLLDAQLPLWTYATFTQNFAMAFTGSWGAHWMSLTWSLAIEEQFYLLTPLLILMIPRRQLGRVLLCAVLLAPLLRLLIYDAPPLKGFAAFMLMPCRMDSLLLGVWGAWMLRQDSWRAWLEKHPARLKMMLGGLLLGVLGLYLAGAWLFSPSMIGPGYTWMAACYLGVILNAVLQPNSWVARIARISWLRYLGRISYGIYLLHQIIAALTHGVWLHQPPQLKRPEDVLPTLLALVLTLATASLSWHLFERRLVARGHRLEYRLAVPG